MYSVASRRSDHDSATLALTLVGRVPVGGETWVRTVEAGDNGMRY
jgi:hypothetical protein